MRIVEIDGVKFRHLKSGALKKIKGVNYPEYPISEETKKIIDEDYKNLTKLFCPSLLNN